MVMLLAISHVFFCFVLGERGDVFVYFKALYSSSLVGTVFRLF